MKWVTELAFGEGEGFYGQVLGFLIGHCWHSYLMPLLSVQSTSQVAFAVLMDLTQVACYSWKKPFSFVLLLDSSAKALSAVSHCRRRRRRRRLLPTLHLLYTAFLSLQQSCFPQTMLSCCCCLLSLSLPQGQECQTSDQAEESHHHLSSILDQLDLGLEMQHFHLLDR